MVTSQPPMKEQRRAPRFRHELVVELHERAGPRRLHAIDVARHGLFLATDDPPRERHLVQLTVHLPGGAIRAAGSVTRTLRGRGEAEDGVGIQFFALSDDAKDRWDDFIFELQRTTPARGTRLPTKEELARPDPTIGGGATFLVKLKSQERLKEFGLTHLAAGGTVLFTPVLRAPGEVVTLIVVHPKSDEE
ncbi:MAG TPA: PilZ domain-containing protein, partial [Myxococcota bacterium]